MIREAKEINISKRQRDILVRMSNATQGELHFKTRATIILNAVADISNRSIAAKMNITRKAVIKWRNRWACASKVLDQIELDSPLKLTEKIKEILSDSYRSGTPPKFTPEQVACIIDLSLQSPESVNVPMTHWTIDALRDKAIELNIVSSVSSSQVERFLKRGRY